MGFVMAQTPPPLPERAVIQIPRHKSIILVIARTARGDPFLGLLDVIFESIKNIDLTYALH